MYSWALVMYSQVANNAYSIQMKEWLVQPQQQARAASKRLKPNIRVHPNTHKAYKKHSAAYQVIRRFWARTSHDILTMQFSSSRTMRIISKSVLWEFHASHNSHQIIDIWIHQVKNQVQTHIYHHKFSQCTIHFQINQLCSPSWT